MQMNRILLNALGVVRDAQTLEAGIQEIRKLSGTLPLLGLSLIQICRKLIVHIAHPLESSLCSLNSFMM